MKKKFRDGELALKILEMLSKTSLNLDNIADSFFTIGTGYKGALTKEQRRALFERRDKRLQEYNTHVDFLREKHKVTVLLHRFKKAGLVRSDNQKKAAWDITSVGLLEIVRLRARLERTASRHISRPKYKVIKSKNPIIIIFDIPEIEKHKRAWIRSVLKNLDFKFLQKSVWIGNNQLPEEFIEDLRKLKIFNSVKIFSVVEQGNIYE